MRLETARLTLRRWHPDDLLAQAAIDGDPDVMRYLGDGATRTPEQTAQWLARMDRAWDERGYGIFAVDSNESGELVGWVGLAVPTFLPEVLPAVEIGWRLARAHWGRGYATEAAREVVRFAFDDADLERLVSICHVDNAASTNVMTKLAMHLDRTTTVPAHGAPVRVMALDRVDHRADHRSAPAKV